jgi:hypothetical protein
MAVHLEVQGNDARDTAGRVHPRQVNPAACCQMGLLPGLLQRGGHQRRTPSVGRGVIATPARRPSEGVAEEGDQGTGGAAFRSSEECTRSPMPGASSAANAALWRTAESGVEAAAAARGSLGVTRTDVI